MEPENRADQRELVRLRNGQFAPGQSGNRGGRPRTIAHVQELSREYTVEAIHALVAIMRNRRAPAAARVAAANSVLDRGWGKATNVVQIEDPRESPLAKMMSETLARFFADEEQMKMLNEPWSFVTPSTDA